MAHENARTLLEVLPSETSELLNEFFAEFTRDLANGLNKRTRFDFLKQTVLRLQTLAGQLDGTMNRNDAYTFLQIGRNLERADMTSRIVDVRSAQLLPADTPELRPFDTVQWMSVLKSLSGYQMYRLRMRSRVRRADVMHFLLRDDQFPRACGFCLDEIRRALLGLPRSPDVLELLDDAGRFLGEADLETLDQAGLHVLVDRLQLRDPGHPRQHRAALLPVARRRERPVARHARARAAQSQSAAATQDQTQTQTQKGSVPSGAVGR
jgi:uncharacterized alpha-E superfamily protein